MSETRRWTCGRCQTTYPMTETHDCVDVLQKRIAGLELTIASARMYLAGVLVNAKISPSHDRDFSIINLINNVDDILKEVRHE